jgi:restriction system protein
MARKRKGDSTLDAWVGLIARLPWWVGVLLAVASYAGLSHVASTSPTATSDIGQLSSMVTQSMLIGLASVGQYLVPFVCLAGSVMSWFRRRHAHQLHADAVQRSDGIAQMGWRDFETLVAEHFRRQGFAATETGGGGLDGGVDVQIRRGSDRYLVQCKHWRARRVGVEPVRELYGLIAAQRLAGGYVVTSGDFTDAARAFAKGREIVLINGQALQRGLRAGASHTAPPVQAPAPPAMPPPAPVSAPSATAPNPAEARAYAPTQPMGLIAASAPSAHAADRRCPLCGATMVLRQARTGAHAGTPFWGCSQFAHTRCWGTRAVEEVTPAPRAR